MNAALELTKRGGGTQFISGSWPEIAKKTTEAIRSDVELQMSPCDCSYTPTAPVLMSATDWLNARREDLKQQIETHRKNDVEERRRAAERTAWVAALRASLPIEGARQESEAAA